jgi:hypothetical protein
MTPLEISLSWISWGSSISNGQEMAGLLYLWLLPKISSWDYCLVFVPDWLGLVDKLVLICQSCLQVTAIWVPLVREKCNHMADPSGDFLSLESPEGQSPRMSRRWWSIFISLSLTLTFPCGINEFVPGLGSDLFWSVGPFSCPFSFFFLMFYYQQLIFISCTQPLIFEIFQG